jgi:hypothetical protein
MVREGARTSASHRDARGERLGEAGPCAALPYHVSDARARWHMALVALPFVLGVLIPVLLLALLYWLS